jgi:hypothetical protein
VGLTAEQVLRYVMFRQQNMGWVEPADLRLHFSPSYDGEVDPLVNALVVSGFLHRDPTYGDLRTGDRGLNTNLLRRVDTTGTIDMPPGTVRTLPGGIALNFDDEGGVLLTAGPVASGWDPDLSDGGCAYFDRDEQLPRLQRALAAAAKAAQAGRPYAKNVSGMDLGDVKVSAVDGNVVLDVVPYDWPFDEDDHPVDDEPDEEVPTWTTDDDGVRIDLDAEQRAAWGEALACEREDRAREKQELIDRWNRDHPPLTATLSPADVAQVAAALDGDREPARMPPAGVPPGVVR